MQKRWGKVCLCLFLLIQASSMQGAEQGEDKMNDGLSMEFLEYLADEQEDGEQIGPLPSKEMIEKTIKKLMEKETGQQTNDE